MRPHFDGGPIGEAARVHGEAVVMLKHRNYISCASLFEQASPRRRIESLRLERGDEVLISELILSPVSDKMMLVLLRARDIHEPRVPLAAKGRN